MRRRKRRQTLSESISITNMVSFFDRLNTITPVSELTPATLAWDYLYNHANEKYVSSLVNRLLEANESQQIVRPLVLNDADILILSGMVRDMYADNWTRLWDALTAEYGILDNTDAHVKQTTTTERTGEDTQTTQYGKTQDHNKSGNIDTTNTVDYGKTTSDERDMTTSGTDSTEHGHVVNGTNDSTNTHSKSAFESGTLTPQNEDVNNGSNNETHSGTDTVTHNSKEQGTNAIKESGTDSTTSITNEQGTDKIIDGGEDNVNGTKHETESITYEETRKGNIGVTTSQQMLESEFKMRRAWRMQEFIYADIDRLLTIPKYKTDL